MGRPIPLQRKTDEARGSYFLFSSYDRGASRWFGGLDVKDRMC